MQFKIIDQRNTCRILVAEQYNKQFYKNFSLE